MHPTAYKSVPFQITELKATDDQWTFSGLASTFGNLDHTGDVVLRGAFDATLQSGTKRRLLWMHDVAEPIGVEQSMRVTDDGLLGTWKISKTARGIDAHELLKDGAVDSLSIGYRAKEFEYDDNDVRLLKEIDLLEVSLVSIPANDQAVVTSVKGLTLDFDSPFHAQIASVIAALNHGAAEAEALFARRLAEGREPSEKAITAATSFKQLAEATASRLSALLAQKAEAGADAEGDVADPVEDAAAVQSAASADLSLRLELARRRLRHAGILERAS